MFTNAAYFHPRPSAAGAGYDAATRGLPPATVSTLVAQSVEEGQQAFLGERRVNVLWLDMGLDEVDQ